MEPGIQSSSEARLDFTSSLYWGYWHATGSLCLWEQCTLRDQWQWPSHSLLARVRNASPDCQGANVPC